MTETKPETDALKEAQEIVNGGNGQAHTYFDLFRKAKKISQALIDRDTPVEMSRATDWKCLSCEERLGRTGNFCPNCGKRLLWK